MSRPRPIGVVVWSLVGLVLVVALAEVSGRAPAASVAPSTRQATRGVALSLLHAWDARRASAYASGSIARLHDLYVPGSEAGAADSHLLASYRSRGFRVVGMRTQVLALTVLQRRADRWTLRVTDRLHRAVAVRAGRRVPLPRDRASIRVLTLVRSADRRWRVSTVVESQPAPGEVHVGCR